MKKGFSLRVGAEFVASHCKSESDVIELAYDADAVIAEYAPLPKRVIEKLERCKVISLNATGYDNVDVKAATGAGIIVVNCPDYCYDEVADHTIALLLACARGIVRFDRQIQKKVWDFKSAGKINRIRGSTLGLIGFGRIARAVAKRAKPFGLNIIAYDPFLPAEIFEENDVRQTSVEDLIRVSDFISIHTPITALTSGLFSEEQFKLMKPSAYLLNVSRGRIVDETELYFAIQTRKIAGAALDVMTNEPPNFNNPLFNLENVIVTPHAAFYSEGAMLEVRRRAVEEVVRILSGKWPENMVNLELRGRTDLRAGILS